MEDAGLEDELDRRVGDVDEPVVVRPAGPGAVDPVALLLEPRGDLDVSRPRDARQLGADPDGVADVLERVRADRERELVVGEGPGLAVADVAGDPGLGSEALAAAIPLAVEPAGLVGHQVDHPVGAGEGLRPARRRRGGGRPRPARARSARCSRRASGGPPRREDRLVELLVALDQPRPVVLGGAGAAGGRRLRARPELEGLASSARARSPSSSASKRRPTASESTISGQPPERGAATGVPAASDSSRTSPKASSGAGITLAQALA